MGIANRKPLTFPIIGYRLLAPPATLSRSDCGRVSVIREATSDGLAE
jgi:hypothetical protein